MRGQCGVAPDQVLELGREVGAGQHEAEVGERDRSAEHDCHAAFRTGAGRDGDSAEHGAHDHEQRRHHAGTQVHAIEVTGRCIERERCRAKARVIVLVVLEALVRQRRQQAERQHRQDRPQQEHLVGFPVAAGEGEAQSTIARIRHAEAQRAHQQKRPHCAKDHGEHQRQRRAHRAAELDHHGQHQHDGAALEDRTRLAVVVERGVIEPRVAVEILERADLGPGGVDAEREHREQRVDDPDTEVFRARSGEREPQRCRRRGGMPQIR
ncbi:hypothetical protein D3C72_1260890 [compost metagenome]